MSLDDQIALYWQRHCNGKIPTSRYLEDFQECIFEDWVGVGNTGAWQAFLADRAAIAQGDVEID